jgi:hypothetical protein
MTPETDTMTTSVTVAWVADVYEKNDVLTLPRTLAVGGKSVEGLVFSHPGLSVTDAHKECLERAMDCIDRALPSNTFSVLAGHGADQPANRIVAYRRLWGSLKARGVDIPKERWSQEHETANSDGVRWFSRLVVESNEAQLVHKIVKEEPASSLVSTPQTSTDKLNDLLKAGWKLPAFGPDPQMLHSVVGIGGVLVFPYGAFDDQGAGQAILGSCEPIRSLRTACRTTQPQ